MAKKISNATTLLQHHDIEVYNQRLAIKGHEMTNVKKFKRKSVQNKMVNYNWKAVQTDRVNYN